MSSKLKLYLGRKVLDCVNKPNISNLQNVIQVENNTKSGNVNLKLPLVCLEAQIGSSEIPKLLKIQPDDIIKQLKIENKCITFEIDKKLFIADVIESCANPDLNLDNEKIVVEYSSPNVAKPFHLGHLRSTIIGNYIGNINKFLRNDVTRINYLGDWGTQFGFIKVGVEDLKYTSENIKENPIKLLYKCYVHANKLAEKDPNILERAKVEFAKLENGSIEDIKNWRVIIGYTKDELKKTYERLGVQFDEYNYESMYGSKDIQDVIDILKNKKLLIKQKDGKETIKMNDKNITILKSDGSTLYLSRDIAAAMHRYKKYNFDKMFYVVENGQHDHFSALKHVIKEMGCKWSDKLTHVKFGRIRGLSTRKGTAVFLNDILDECRELMIQKQVLSPNTKVPISDDRISDILGISCVIVNDLKQRRQKDYEFDWDRVLQVQGDTGVKFQYTHCRLCSLEQNSGATPAKVCVPEALDEPEALILLKHLAKFQEVLLASQEQLEACILVNYLFHLCNHISKALKVLQIKGANPDIASQRLLLFNTSREVLKNGMNILGLQPLNQM
ncbi:unnamed protein product [Brassicogethes aeneus]|uniref:Probable arginine--tRNA ligase, mitochondrial n=1 Tax=Brassicogethes aeneus TaxID=1431903 RepID=A0A9P0AMX4_BRAAE|nr:unnamed protein product [Brassicogethes aeneus]